MKKRTGWMILALVTVGLTLSSCYETRYSERWDRRDHRYRGHDRYRDHDRWESRHHHGW